MSFQVSIKFIELTMWITDVKQTKVDLGIISIEWMIIRYFFNLTCKLVEQNITNLLGWFYLRLYIHFLNFVNKIVIVILFAKILKEKAIRHLKSSIKSY